VKKLYSWITLHIFFVFFALSKAFCCCGYSNLKQDYPKRKNAIVVGASSGMGREVAKHLAHNGYTIGLVARRIELLRSLQAEIITATYIKQIDVTQTENARYQLQELIREMGGIDLMFISITAIPINNDTITDVSSEALINVDVKGFEMVAHVALEEFIKQKSGHLVGIHSIDSIRGSAAGPVYCGVKSFEAIYLEGIRNKMIQEKLPIYVTEIIPGFIAVDPEIASQKPGHYWDTSYKEAGKQIFDAIKKKKKRAYISKRWEIIAWLLRITPDWLYNWLGGF
jgi:short-subunit dehydrogenase